MGLGSVFSPVSKEDGRGVEQKRYRWQNYRCYNEIEVTSLLCCSTFKGTATTNRNVLLILNHFTYLNSTGSAGGFNKKFQLMVLSEYRSIFSFVLQHYLKTLIHAEIYLNEFSIKTDKLNV